jgi:hypothetical protein
MYEYHGWCSLRWSAGEVDDGQRSASAQSDTTGGWEQFQKLGEAGQAGDSMGSNLRASGSAGSSATRGRASIRRWASLGVRILAHRSNPDAFTAEAWDRFAPLRQSSLKTSRAWATKEFAMTLRIYRRRGWARQAWQRWYSWAIALASRTDQEGGADGQNPSGRHSHRRGPRHHQCPKASTRRSSGCPAGVSPATHAKA